jgi:hypothetical protein
LCLVAARAQQQFLGVIYIFIIIGKVTRWFSTLKRAPTDLALL